MQRRGPVGPLRVQHRTLAQQECDHRRVSRTGRLVQRAVPLPVPRVGVGARIQQGPCHGKVSGSCREVEGRIPVVVGDPRIGARLDQPGHCLKVRRPFGAPRTRHVGGVPVVRHPQDGMVQRRAAVLVASQRVGTCLDAADDVGGERHAAEHPPVPVIAMGGVGHAAELVTRGRIGPEPQELARHERVRVAPRAMQRSGSVSVPCVEIGSGLGQRADHRRIRRVQRCAVQYGRAEVDAGVRVGPQPKAVRYPHDGGRLEELPAAPVVAALGDGGRGRHERENGKSADTHDHAPPDRKTDGSGRSHVLADLERRLRYAGGV